MHRGVPVAMADKVKKHCKPILDEFKKEQGFWIFQEPVDPSKWTNSHNYFEVIQNPMDLGTVRTKLMQNQYPSYKSFADDVRLTFRNAMIFNPPGQQIHEIAKNYLGKFEAKYAELMAKVSREIQGTNQQASYQRPRMPGRSVVPAETKERVGFGQQRSIFQKFGRKTAIYDMGNAVAYDDFMGTYYSSAEGSVESSFPMPSKQRMGFGREGTTSTDESIAHEFGTEMQPSRKVMNIYSSDDDDSAQTSDISTSRKVKRQPSMKGKADIIDQEDDAAVELGTCDVSLHKKPRIGLKTEMQWPGIAKAGRIDYSYNDYYSAERYDVLRETKHGLGLEKQEISYKQFAGVSGMDGFAGGPNSKHVAYEWDFAQNPINSVGRYGRLRDKDDKKQVSCGKRETIETDESLIQNKKEEESIRVQKEVEKIAKQEHLRLEDRVIELMQDIDLPPSESVIRKKVLEILNRSPGCFKYEGGVEPGVDRCTVDLSDLSPAELKALIALGEEIQNSKAEAQKKQSEDHNSSPKEGEKSSSSEAKEADDDDDTSSTSEKYNDDDYRCLSGIRDGDEDSSLDCSFSST